MPYPTRIILTGFMGSGKSTVGRLLATRLNYAFLDLDTAIESRTSKSVPEIFATEGESAFRLHEHLTLAEALTQTQIVIALGGGAVETPANHDLLGASTGTAVILLSAPFSILYDRCLQQSLDPTATTRPNLITRTHAESRFTRRAPLYAATSTHTVSVQSHTPAEAVDNILALLNP